MAIGPENLLHRLKAIEERNRRVEADKAWERSGFRIMLIAALTYGIAAVFLLSTNLPNPFLNALVPTIGYVLSMQSIPAIKKWWLQKHQR